MIYQNYESQERFEGGNPKNAGGKCGTVDVLNYSPQAMSVLASPFLCSG
jgi:hypothetical protein